MNARSWIGAVALAAALGGGAAEAKTYGAAPKDLSARLDRLVAAYPEFLVRHDGAAVYWRDGTVMPVSDGRTNKDWTAFLNAPDLDDMLAQPYPIGEITPPGFRQDPGRVRFEPFFTKMYGDCRKTKIKRVAVRWVDGKTLRVTPVNGVAKRLRRVSAELAKLPAKYRKISAPSAGVFNCRNIAGTKRLSVHSFAAAIDLNIKYSHYWRWTKARADNPKKPLPFRNRIPRAIVDIFEREGFIWGGRWYHYDTMHFEYRPELLPADFVRPL